MSSWFLPDFVFSKFDDITPEFLQDLGIKALLIDIDNTLAPYEVSEPDERIINWFKRLEDKGICATLVSNNERERVELFNQKLGLPYYYKSGKPFAKNLKKAMAAMQSDPSNTAMIGDQLLTDAAAGKHIGLTTIIVPPINDKNNAFFRAKRALEVPTIKRYVKAHGNDDIKAHGNDDIKARGDDAARVCEFWIKKKYKKKNRG